MSSRKYLMVIPLKPLLACIVQFPKRWLNSNSSLEKIFFNNLKKPKPTDDNKVRVGNWNQSVKRASTFRSQII